MKKLSKLSPAEVSLVPKGANRKKFLIMKSFEGVDQMNLEEMMQKVQKADPTAQAKITSIVKAAMKKSKKADDDEDDDEDEEDVEKSKAQKSAAKKADDKSKEEDDPRLQACMKAVSRIMAPFKDQLKKGHIDSILADAGISGDEAEEHEDAGEPGEAEVSAAKAAGEKAYKSHLEKMGYAKYPDAQMAMKEKTKKQKDPKEKAKGDKEEDKVSKQAVTKEDGTLDLSAIPEEIRPTVEAIYKGQAELVKKNEALETQLKEVQAQKIEKELTDKVEGLKHLGADKAKLVMVLKGLTPEALKEVEAVLKAADEQIAKGDLFKEAGSNQSNNQANDAWEKIEKAAEGYVAKSGEKLSKAQGVEAFLNTAEGQKMYAEFKTQKGGV